MSLWHGGELEADASIPVASAERSDSNRPSNCGSLLLSPAIANDGIISQTASDESSTITSQASYQVPQAETIPATPPTASSIVGSKVLSAKDKRKSYLRSFFLLQFLIVSFLVAVSAFLGLSQTRNGLWVVRKWQYAAEDKGTFRDRSLVWTTIPPLVLTLLNIIMKDCYEHILDLEPLLRLYQQRPTSGSNSILVNYQRESFFATRYHVIPT